MNKENNFWIVVDDNFPTRVSYKHNTYISAQQEAQRLAKQNRGSKFVVMKSVDAYEIQELVRTDYVDPTDNPNDNDFIPF